MSNVPLDAGVATATTASRHGLPDTPAAFRACTAWGDVQLTLHDRGVMPHRLDDNVRAALLLDRIEPLLRWLEDGLGSSIDPEPHPPSPHGTGVCAQWHGPAVDASVVLPWSLLRAFDPPEDDAARWQRELQWQAVAVELELSRQALSDAEWQALQHDGAGLLLPESFAGAGGGAWPCLLRSLEGDLECKGHWRVTQQQVLWQERWHGAPAVAGDAPALRMTRVCLSRPLMLSPPALLGWHGASSCSCTTDDALRITRDGAPGALHGHLVPIGLRAAPALAADLPSSSLLHSGYVLRVSHQGTDAARSIPS